DDVRSIDWRATARRRSVVVRTWRPERDRHVLLVVDTSRSSAGRLGEATRLDAAFDAALLLTALAVQAGDRVDLVCVDRVPHLSVIGSTRTTVLHDMVSATAAVDPALVETDWELDARTIGARARRGALVVLITALDAAAVHHGAARRGLGDGGGGPGPGGDGLGARRPHDRRARPARCPGRADPPGGGRRRPRRSAAGRGPSGQGPPPGGRLRRRSRPRGARLRARRPGVGVPGGRGGAGTCRAGGGLPRARAGGRPCGRCTTGSGAGGAGGHLPRAQGGREAVSRGGGGVRAAGPGCGTCASAAGR